MSVGARVRAQLAKHAPGLEERAVRAHWRRRNRDRAFAPEQVTDPALRALLDGLSRDGVAVGTFDELIGDRALFEAAAARARELHAAWRPEEEAEAGSKASYLTKLATGEYSAHDPFVRIALHPNVLPVA